MANVQTPKTTAQTAEPAATPAPQGPPAKMVLVLARQG